MNRPYIICHMMSSIDGKIDCAMTAKCPGVDEYYRTLSELNVPTTLSGKITAQLELAEQGSFTSKNKTPIGATTFRKNTAEGCYSVVVDTIGTLLWKNDIVDGKPLIVITSENAAKEYLAYLESKKISWIACGKRQIDLARACEILCAEFGVKRMGVVGGGSINAGFLDAGLLDEVSILYTPAIDGRVNEPASFANLPAEREPFILRLKSVQQYGDGCVWMRYDV